MWVNEERRVYVWVNEGKEGLCVGEEGEEDVWVNEGEEGVHLGEEGRRVYVWVKIGRRVYE